MPKYMLMIEDAPDSGAVNVNIAFDPPLPADRPEGFQPTMAQALGFTLNDALQQMLTPPEAKKPEKDIIILPSRDIVLPTLVKPKHK